MLRNKGKVGASPLCKVSLKALFSLKPQDLSASLYLLGLEGQVVAGSLGKL